MNIKQYKIYVLLLPVLVSFFIKPADIGWRLSSRQPAVSKISEQPGLLLRLCPQYPQQKLTPQGTYEEQDYRNYVKRYYENKIFVPWLKFPDTRFREQERIKKGFEQIDLENKPFDQVFNIEVLGEKKYNDIKIFFESLKKERDDALQWIRQPVFKEAFRQEAAKEYLIRNFENQYYQELVREYLRNGLSPEEAHKEASAQASRKSTEFHADAEKMVKQYPKLWGFYPAREAWLRFETAEPQWSRPWWDIFGWKKGWQQKRQEQLRGEAFATYKQRFERARQEAIAKHGGTRAIE